MQNPKTKKSLAALIKESVVIGDLEKEEFLELLPSLNQEQIDEVVDFFVSAGEKTAKIDSEHDEKQSQLYAESEPELDVVFKSADQAVYSATVLAKFKNN